MGSHHHHIAAKNVLHLADLQALFGGDEPRGRGASSDICGERYLHLLQEMSTIVEHQWRVGASRGLVKGFLLCGPPGTGKTTLAKRLTYELALRFREDGEDAVALAFIDGAEVSRSRYGESEERIIDIFAHAKAGFTAAGQRSVLLFDDVESIFMERGSQHAKEWHFSQDSVFFHAVDEVDTSRAIIVLTTNRPDLVDAAIRDRFLSYTIDYPDAETLVTVGVNLAAAQIADLASFEARLRGRIAEGSLRSLRDVQRFVLADYVSHLLGRLSLAG